MQPAQLIELNDKFDRLVSVALGFAGIGFFIMLLVGGFRYITSGGDQKTAGAAKGTLTYGFGGMILIACSYLIIRFLADFTGVNCLTDFNIFFSFSKAPC